MDESQWRRPSSQWMSPSGGVPVANGIRLWGGSGSHAVPRDGSSETENPGAIQFCRKVSTVLERRIWEPVNSVRNGFKADPSESKADPSESKGIHLSPRRIHQVQGGSIKSKADPSSPRRIHQSPRRIRQSPGEDNLPKRKFVFLECGGVRQHLHS